VDGRLGRGNRQALMIYRFRGDKIAQQWAAEDWAALLGQVGYTTLPWGRSAPMFHSLRRMRPT
jgi:hypothetical protein